MLFAAPYLETSQMVLVQQCRHRRGDVFEGAWLGAAEEQLAWAVRLGNESLKDEVDRVLARWRESGRLDVILMRWIPVRRWTLG